MSENIHQLFIANPASTMQGTDLFYLGRSPYSVTNDMAITWTNTMSSITVVGTLTSGIWNATTITSTYGGTGVSNPAAHSIPIAEGSSNFNFIGPMTNGQILIGSTGADPVNASPTNGTNISWSTGAGTLTANLSGTIASTLGGTGVSSPTAHTLPVAEGSSAYTFLGPLTNGQLLIGSTGVDPVPSTLTASNGINISNGTGSISISATGVANNFVIVTGTSQSMLSNTRYRSNNSSLVTLTLPSISNPGDLLSISGMGTGGFKIAQNSGNQIFLGTSSTTLGITGSLQSTNQYDSIWLECLTTNANWAALGAPQGNITVV